MINEQAQNLSEYRLNSEADAQNQYENAILFIREIESKRESFIEGKLSLPVITSIE